MQRHKVQDATGVINSKPPMGILDVVKFAAPTNTDSGYAIGCVWRNLAGTAGSIFYVNIGSATSATWQAIT